MDANPGMLCQSHHIATFSADGQSVALKSRGSLWGRQVSILVLFQLQDCTQFGVDKSINT